jgi:hypothetical protein
MKQRSSLQQKEKEKEKKLDRDLAIYGPAGQQFWCWWLRWKYMDPLRGNVYF